MTQIDKIKAEIERLMNWKPKAIPSGMRQRDVLNIRKGVLLTLKDFINSLPAEQLCWNDMTEEEKSDFFFDLSHQKQIEQPSEDLEEEIKRKYKSDIGLMMPIEDFRKLIHHFTDWQKEQMMKSAVNGVMDCDDSNEWAEITDRFVVTPSRAGKKEKAILFMEDEQLNNKVNVEPPSFEESQGEFNSYNVALNG